MSSAGKEFDEQFRLFMAEKARPVQEAMECAVMDLGMLIERLGGPFGDDEAGRWRLVTEAWSDRTLKYHRFVLGSFASKEEAVAKGRARAPGPDRIWKEWTDEAGVLSFRERGGGDYDFTVEPPSEPEDAR